MFVVDQDENEIPYVSILDLKDDLRIKPELKGYMTCIVTLSGNISDLAGNCIDKPIVLSFDVFGYPPGSPENLKLEMNESQTRSHNQ